MSDTPRIQPTDCLYAIYTDLRKQAKALQPYDCDARLNWLAACVDVLAAVKDRDQQFAWAYHLSLDFLGKTPGLPIDFLMRQLLAGIQVKA